MCRTTAGKLITNPILMVPNPMSPTGTPDEAASDPESEPAADTHGSDDGEASGHDDSDDVDDRCPNGHSCDKSDDDSSPCADVEQEGDGPSQDSLLSKETLLLGEEPSSATPMDTASESEEEPDSQVSSGWMGKAYNRESRQVKAREDKEHAMKRLTQEPLTQLSLFQVHVFLVWDVIPTWVGAHMPMFTVFRKFICPCHPTF